MKSSKLFFILLTLIHTQSVSANQNIIVDDQLSPNTSVIIDKKSNKEIINITQANKDNISVNFYQKFDVTNKGIILNNEQAKANVIINQITGDDMTSLNGNIKVEGKKAHVIIANPNGVECYKCSFSHVSKLTLISGKTNDNINEFILSDKNYVSVHNIKYSSATKLNIISNEVFIDGYLSQNITTLNIVNGISTYHLSGKTNYNRKGRISFFENFQHSIEKIKIMKNKNNYKNIYLDEKIIDLKEKTSVNSRLINNLDLY